MLAEAEATVAARAAATDGWTALIENLAQPLGPECGHDEQQASLPWWPERTGARVDAA